MEALKVYRLQGFFIDLDPSCVYIARNLAKLESP